MTRFGYTLDQGFDAVQNTVQESDQLKFLYDYAQELEALKNTTETFSTELANEYKALHLDQSRAMIFWSGPMAIRGIRPAADIDVLVTNEYYDELLTAYPNSEVKSGKMVVGNIDICRGDAGLCSFVNEAMENGQMVRDMNFMALADVLRLKMHRRLPKDFADIVRIKHYLKKNVLT